MPQMYSWLTGAPPSGSEKKLSSSLRENLRVDLFSPAKLALKAQTLTRLGLLHAGSQYYDPVTHQLEHHYLGIEQEVA